MHFNNKLGYLSASVMLAVSQMADAGTDIFFNPLTQSAAVATVVAKDEELSISTTQNHPWQ
nr:hypothetical protein [Gammaproteobacteria bacterium]